MHVVAIGELGPRGADALGPLAADLGTTLYELRLVVNAGLPAVVVTTVDPAVAARAVAACERHGIRPLACDRREVVTSARMTVLRDFRLELDGLVAEGADGDGSPYRGDRRERLPYGDVAALVRATHRSTTETTKEIKERKFRPGMALATGGLVVSKTTTKEVTSRTEQREQVLYLFRRSGAPPWILKERLARYAGLGADLRPTSLENFTTTIRRLRELSPTASYDERLMTGRPVRGIADGADATDLLAHLVAMGLA